MDSNHLDELYLAVFDYLTEHESGAFGLDEGLTSDIVTLRAAYLTNRGIVALPVKLEAAAPEMFARWTVLIARNQVAMGDFLTDLRSRSEGTTTVTVLMN